MTPNSWPPTPLAFSTVRTPEPRKLTLLDVHVVGGSWQSYAKSMLLCAGCRRNCFLTGRLRVASWYCSEPYDRSARKVAPAGGGGWRSSRRCWLRSSALAQPVLRLDGAPSVKQLLPHQRCQLKRVHAYSPDLTRPLGHA